MKLKPRLIEDQILDSKVKICQARKEGSITKRDVRASIDRESRLPGFAISRVLEREREREQQNCKRVMRR